MPSRTSVWSAICGIHLGETNAVASIAARPASPSRSISSSLTAVGTSPGSFWRPSRGPISTIRTCLGSDIMGKLYLPRDHVMPSLSCSSVLTGHAPADTPVTVKGWVRTRRDSKAGISFVNVSDGSSFHPVQVVAPNTLANYAAEVQHLTAGCALEATGTIVPSPAKGQPFEMQAAAIRVVGWIDDPDSYPIQPKPHSLEFLREVAHLRPRTNVIGAATRVRHTLAQAIHRFFHERGFLWVNTPIITAADAEGAGALFRVSTLDLMNVPKSADGRVDFAQDFFGR